MFFVSRGCGYICVVVCLGACLCVYFFERVSLVMYILYL